MSYSNGSGGTLTLPSPTHVHHVDVGSAVRSLRRSLSRSPSKFSLRSGNSAAVGLAAPGTPSSEANGGFRLSQSTTPPTPLAEASTTLAGTPFGAPSFTSPTPQQSQNTSTPLRSSVKLSLRSARTKPTASRPLSRPRLGVSPKSPLKRVFGPSPDSGNPSPAPLAEPAPQGQENPSFNDFALALSPVSRRNLEKPSRHSMHLDVSGSSKNGLGKFLGTNTDSFASISVSPMKRSDAMCVDESSLGSPVAKRRSLHGASNLGSFNFLDIQSNPHSGPGASQSFDIHEDANHEYQLTGSLASPFREPREAPPTPSAMGVVTMPKRTSSLRKSTLQQRHGENRTSWGRRHGEKQLAQLTNGSASPSRPRLTLDQYASPDDRTGLFSQVSAQNPPLHPAPRPPNQPHPLSRTLTQSSSNSSVPDDSPTHIPIPLGERPRAPMNFSKSLPLGSTRPVDGSKPMATPDYKHAKPHQGAFMSTGLVSKMTRHPENGPGGVGGKIAAMPDTPCKKQYNSNTYPPQHSGGRRVSRPSLGSPSTPFAASLSGPGRGNIFGNRDRSANLFCHPNRAGHHRKVSLLSVDGDDHGEVAGSQDDIPPTPTKNFFRALGTTPAQAVRTPNPTRTSLVSQPAPGEGAERPASSPSSSPLHADLLTDAPPRTPQDSMAPPDASRLSISNARDEKLSLPRSRTPATPTAPTPKIFAGPGDRRSSITPHNSHRPKDVDESLVRLFDKAEVIGRGEFSQVYRVVKSSVPVSLSAVFGDTPSKRAPHSLESKEVYAVKKLRLPITGVKARAARLREVEILTALSHSNKIVHYIGSWETKGHLYIQTEFCHEGSLDRYLELIGKSGKLDQFRVWKIFSEILEGLHAIHNGGFVHLDLKPANIFITQDGYLKIGDFGMAVKLPAGKDVDGEGDREYIAPEILLGKIDKPADIFSLGLVIMEAACNVVLPDNGPSWQALRHGDFSSIALIANGETTMRDPNGVPLENIFDDSGYYIPLEKRRSYPFSVTHNPSNLFGIERKAQELNPPHFMSSPSHDGSLDALIRRMLDPDPSARPTVEYLLSIYPIAWVNHRRTAGAIVYEGEFGLVPTSPEPPRIPIMPMMPMDDTVMTDAWAH